MWVIHKVQFRSTATMTFRYKLGAYFLSFFLSKVTKDLQKANRANGTLKLSSQADYKRPNFGFAL